MDKFGIFNLLSSFLGGTPPKNAEESGAPEYGGKPLLTSEERAAEMRARSRPLQSAMLATMKNHDEFVKRVKESAKKQR